LHQFISETCVTITDKPSIQNLHRTAVIDAAFQHDYLLHAILALSALHLFRKDLERPSAETSPNEESQRSQSPISPQTETYLLAGRQHHNRALQSLHENLPTLNRENCHAMFVALGLVFLGFRPYIVTESSIINLDPLSLPPQRLVITLKFQYCYKVRYLRHHHHPTPHHHGYLSPAT